MSKNNLVLREAPGIWAGLVTLLLFSVLYFSGFSEKYLLSFRETLNTWLTPLSLIVLGVAYLMGYKKFSVQGLYYWIYLGLAVHLFI